MIDHNNDVIKLLALVDTCIRASSDSDEITNILAMIKTLIPFQAITVAIDTNEEFSLTAKQQIFTQDLSDEWQDIYFQRKFYNHDPVLAAILNTASAVDWRTASNEAKYVSADFTNISQKYVGQDGISILVKTNIGSTILSLVMAEGSIQPQYYKLLEYIAPHVHEVFNRQGDNQRNRLRMPKLSTRELEVISCGKEGNNNADISTQLSISERTVKFHFSNIFTKLGVKNRSQAVATAIRYGLILA